MLGRHHISISIATLLPFLIPLIFLNNVTYLTLGFYFLFAALIGSLVPDTDCGGKATIYYRFRPVYEVMTKLVIKLVILIFKIPKLKGKIKEGYTVKEEHRGIMHSPIGILFSSFILTIILTILSIILGLFSFKVILVLFLGLIAGQLLHILEDSCTIAGINWKFPFGEKRLSGNIYTFSKYYGYIDIRPAMYGGLLFVFSIIILIAYTLEKIAHSLWLVYPFIFLITILLWVIFLLTAGVFGNKRETPRIWKMSLENVKKLKKSRRNFIKNASQIQNIDYNKPKGKKSKNKFDLKL